MTARRGGRAAVARAAAVAAANVAAAVAAAVAVAHVAALATALAACGGAPPVAPAPVPAPAPPPAPAPTGSCLLEQPAPCISAAPIRVGTELLAWSDWIASYAAAHATDHPRPITECRWIAELPDVLLCGSPDKEAMNPPLVRASIFVENRPRVVVSRGDRLYRAMLRDIGGHDLVKRHPRGTHPDLLGYYAALDAACAAEAALCPDPGETAMRALLERAWADRPRFVVLTFAHHGGVADDEAVSHEVLHAQYFTQPAFRAAIDDYWRGLPEATRAALRADLGAAYNPGDDELLANELMAYALMSGAEASRFGHLVPAHRPALARLLAARGLRPVAVQRRPRGG